ncbi:MAG: hypothetical protein ACK5KQ_03310 [Anaerorhabdus sp.]
MRKILKTLLALATLLTLVGCKSVDKEKLKEELNLVVNEELLTIDNGANFDPLNAVNTDETVGNVTFKEIDVDTTQPTTFEFTYTLTHEKSKDVTKEVIVKYTVLDKISLELLEEEITLALNEEVNILDYITYSGILEDITIDTTTIGDTTYSINVTNQSKSETLTKELRVKVVDKTPTLENYEEKFTVNANSKYDFKVKAYDYLGNELEVEVIGDWNSKKQGEYPLQYKAVDSEGNEIVKDFTFITKKTVSKNSNKTLSNNTNKTNGSNTSNNTENNTTNNSENSTLAVSDNNVACPNAVYDKSKPCDWIASPLQGVKQFYGGDYGQKCWDYGKELENQGKWAEGANSYACSGLLNNMAVESGMDFGWVYTEDLQDDFDKIFEGRLN